MKFTLEIETASLNEKEDEEAIREILKGLGTSRTWSLLSVIEHGPFRKLYRVQECPDTDITINISET